MILVTGASGNVGRQVVEQLVAVGEPVRVLSRHPERTRWPAGVEPVTGDLTAGVPEEAFAGVRALHLFPVPETAAEVLARAAAAGVEHVTVLSSLSVLFPGNPLARRHRDVEEAAEQSGLGWTHVRPGMFMTNTLQWAPSIAAESVVRQPFPNSTAAPVHEADIAAVAVAALREPEFHLGAAYPLSGPEALSQLDRVRIISEVLGREVRFEEQSREEARAQMLANPWMTDALVDTLLDLMAGGDPSEDPVLPGVPQVLGRPARTFAGWVQQHRKAFSARE